MRPWWQRWYAIVIWIFLGIGIISAIAGGDTRKGDRAAKSVTATTPATPLLTVARQATTPRPVATVPPTIPPAPGFSGDGVFLVGQTIQPGLYVSRSNTGCYWERARDASGNFGSIIDNDNVVGQALVQINAGEVFKTTRCQRWTVYSPPATPLQSFGDGTWAVNTQVAPGRWQSAGSTSSCYWARLRNLDGGVGSIAANDNISGPTIVDISSGDFAFTSNRCGTWTRIG